MTPIRAGLTPQLNTLKSELNQDIKNQTKNKYKGPSWKKLLYCFGTFTMYVAKAVWEKSPIQMMEDCTSKISMGRDQNLKQTPVSNLNVEVVLCYT